MLMLPCTWRRYLRVVQIADGMANTSKPFDERMEIVGYGVPRLHAARQYRVFLSDALEPRAGLGNFFGGLLGGVPCSAGEFTQHTHAHA